MSGISYTQPVILSCLTAICYVAYSFGDGLPTWVRVLLGLFAIIFMAFVLVGTVDIIVSRGTEAYRNYKRASSITPVSLAMEQARNLNPEQIALVIHSQEYLKRRLLPGNQGPISMFEMGDMEVPQAFIREYLDHCTEEELCPIREYSDSKQRDYAGAFVDFVCYLGLAERGSGNQRATWIEPLSVVRGYFGV